MTRRRQRPQTYIDHVVVKEEPEVVTLDNADVVSAVRSAAAVYHHRHQVIEAVRVDSIV